MNLPIFKIRFLTALKGVSHQNFGIMYKRLHILLWTGANFGFWKHFSPAHFPLCNAGFSNIFLSAILLNIVLRNHATFHEAESVITIHCAFNSGEVLRYFCARKCLKKYQRLQFYDSYVPIFDETPSIVTKCTVQYFKLCNRHQTINLPMPDKCANSCHERGRKYKLISAIPHAQKCA